MKSTTIGLSVLMAGLIVSAANAQTSTACTAIPDEKIAYQLFNLSRILRPAPVNPAPAAAPEPQANAAAPGAAPAGAPAAGRGQRVQVPTPPELLDSHFSAMQKIGFKNVERFSDTLGQPLETYKSIAQKTGQNVIGSHGNLDMAQWDKLTSDAVALGQKFIGSGGYGQPGFKTLEDTLATAANLNALGKVAAEKGLRVYAHNHAPELNTKYDYDLNKDGKSENVSVWEIIAANTDPRYVSFEVDIHWARVGMGLDKFDDLLAFLNKYQNRIEMLHVKDTTADGKITDLGQGTTNWPAVFKAAGTNVKYYVWEYDGVPDVFKSGDIAYRYLRCQK